MTNSLENKPEKNIEAAKAFMGRWLIENTDISSDINDAYNVLHYAFDAHVAERIIIKMMANYVKEKDLIIRAIEEGAGEWQMKASDWKHKFWQAANALKELVELKNIKEVEGETPNYLERKPKAWVTAKLLVEEINKLTDGN